MAVFTALSGRVVSLSRKTLTTNIANRARGNFLRMPKPVATVTMRAILDAR